MNTNGPSGDPLGPFTQEGQSSGVTRPRMTAVRQQLLRVLATPANQTAAKTEETGRDEQAARRLRDGRRLAAR